MAKIFSFRPYRYSSKAGSLANLVTQPYDKISPDMQESYYSLSPYNVIRLIKGREEANNSENNNVYTRAATTMEKWIAEGILEQEPEPALFPYFQQFRHPETNEVFTRKGFIGLTQALDYSAGVVYGHELTHSGPKLDRLELTRRTKTHFGQLFVLYDDPEFAVDATLDEAAAGPPAMAVDDEFGVTHKVWKMSDPEAIRSIQAAMEPKKLLIADGHHRYETVLAYAKENPEVPGADKVMMTFVNMRAPGLVVLAGHRVFDSLPDFDPVGIVKSATEFFDVERLDSVETLQAQLDDPARGPATIGAVFQGVSQPYALTVKPEAVSRVLSDLAETERSLNVVVLHKVLLDKVLGVSEADVKELKHIRYIRGLNVAVDEVRSGRAQAAFLLRPVDVQKVAEISFAGGVMPQKSTDFYPKLLAGLTIYRFG